MIRIRSIAACLVASLIGTGACRKSESKREMGSAPGTSATSVSLTAAQIQHGGVKWGPVTMGTASAVAGMERKATSQAAGKTNLKGILRLPVLPT